MVKKLLPVLLLLAGCVSKENAVGTYCSPRPEGQDCITLQRGDTYTQVYQTADSTYTYTGTWSLSNGNILQLMNFHLPDSGSHSGTEVVNKGAILDFNTIIFSEDLPEHNYKKQ